MAALLNKSIYVYNSNVLNMDASQVTSGTLPDDRFPWIELSPVANGGDCTTLLQGALNRLVYTNHFGPISGGGRIRLKHGVYPFSGQLITTNNCPLNWEMDGDGEISSLLLYTGNTNAFISVSTSSVPCMNFTWRNFGFAYKNDTNLARIVWFTNVNECLVENVLVATYNCINTTNRGSSLQYIAGVPTNKVGIIGFQWGTGADNKNVFINPHFYGLAAGAVLKSDHVTMYDPFFGNIGHWWNNGVKTLGTAWTPVTVEDDSARYTNMFAFGCGYIADDSVYDATLINPQFFETHGCYVNNNVSGQGPFLVVKNPLVESCEYRSLITYNSSDGDVGFTSTENWTDTAGWNDGILSLLDGSVADTTTATFSINVVERHSNGDFAKLINGATISQLPADGSFISRNGNFRTVGASGANTAGTDMILTAGQSTGTGRGGAIIEKTSPSGSSSSFQNNPATRRYVSAKEVALTESSATLVFNVSIASGKSASIRVFASTRADDSTNFQERNDSFVVTAVNKGGSVTASISTIGTGDTSAALSSGTLTTTWTAVANGSSVDIKNSAVSSLTQTTLNTAWRADIDSNDSSSTVTPN